MLSLTPATPRARRRRCRGRAPALARFDPDAPPETRSAAGSSGPFCLPLRADVRARARRSRPSSAAPRRVCARGLRDLRWGVNLLQNFARGLLRPFPGRTRQLQRPRLVAVARWAPRTARCSAPTAGPPSAACRGPTRSRSRTSASRPSRAPCTTPSRRARRARRAFRGGLFVRRREMSPPPRDARGAISFPV